PRRVGHRQDRTLRTWLLRREGRPDRQREPGLLPDAVGVLWGAGPGGLIADTACARDAACAKRVLHARRIRFAHAVSRALSSDSFTTIHDAATRACILRRCRQPIPSCSSTPPTRDIAPAPRSRVARRVAPSARAIRSAV